MDFEKMLNEKTEYVNGIINKYLPKEEGFQKTVIEAINYSILAGGKRIRPILMMETYNLFNNRNNVKNINKDALDIFMVAMESIHTYSLVHDDLPAMDNDDLRRGMPTTHAKYGHAMGVLAGDGLLNYAFELVSKAFNDENDMTDVAKAFEIIASKPNLNGMLGGQAVDVELTGKKPSAEQIIFIYKLKTAALIEASMMIGAILAKASDDEVTKICEISRNIGMAFQIQDDILDIVSTDEELGKPVNSDVKNNKVTYVSLYGIDKAKESVKEYSDKAINGILQLEGKNDFLVKLVDMLISRKK